MFGRSKDIANSKPPKAPASAPKLPIAKASKAAAPIGASVPENPQTPEPPKLSKAEQDKQEQYYELKAQLHRKLVEQLDITRVSAEDGDLRAQVREVVVGLVEAENMLLNFSEKQRLIEEVLDETFGLGPLEALLTDPSISDILINGP